MTEEKGYFQANTMVAKYQKALAEEKRFKKAFLVEEDSEELYLPWRAVNKKVKELKPSRHMISMINNKIKSRFPGRPPIASTFGDYTITRRPFRAPP